MVFVSKFVPAVALVLALSPIASQARVAAPAHQTPSYTAPVQSGAQLAANSKGRPGETHIAANSKGRPGEFTPNQPSSNAT